MIDYNALGISATRRFHTALKQNENKNACPNIIFNLNTALENSRGSMLIIIKKKRSICMFIGF